MSAPTSTTNRRKKIALVGGAAIAGLIAFASVDGLYSAPEAVSPIQSYSIGTGEFDISVAPDTSRTWAKELPPMAAGDIVYAYATLGNNSDVEIGNMQVKARPTGSLLDGSTPLVVKLEGCSKSWTEKGACSGNTVEMFPANNSGTHELTYRIPPRGKIFVKATAELPASANNDYQDSVGTMGYEFTAEQAVDESSFPKPERR